MILREGNEYEKHDLFHTESVKFFSSPSCQATSLFIKKKTTPLDYKPSVLPAELLSPQLVAIPI